MLQVHGFRLNAGAWRRSASRVRQDPDAEPLLVVAVHELAVRIERCELLPEPGYAAGPGPAAAPVFDDVMKEDQSAVADEVPVGNEVLPDPLITVVAVDEEHIDHLPAEELPYSLDAVLGVGRHVEEPQLQLRRRQQPENFLVLDVEIDAEKLLQRRQETHEEERRSAERGADLTHDPRARLRDAGHGGLDLPGDLARAGGHVPPRELDALLHAAGALELCGERRALAMVQLQQQRRIGVR